MENTYGQFCTVARGAEVLCERWTLLVVRELLWDVRRFARIPEFPSTPVVIHFQFRDARAGERAWWLVVEDGVADLCRDDPGRELTLMVDASVRALTEVWAGDLTPEEALRSREIRVDGAKRAAQDLWRWLGTSAFASTRRAAGRTSAGATP